MNQDAGCGGPLMVTLRLESGEELPFMVDTGSPLTLLDKSLEPQLGKRVGTMRIATVGHPLLEEGLYAAPKLYLGNVLLVGGSRVATRDIKGTRFKRAKGILGMDCLGHYCIQLNFESGKIRFLDRERMNLSELGKALPLTLRQVGPQGKFLRPLIDQGPLCGTSTNVMVDTGCVPDGLMPRSEMPSEGGGVERTNLTQCVWNGQVYTNLNIAATGQFYSLGLRFLARHLVTLDFPGRMLYLKVQRMGPLPGPEARVVDLQGGATGGEPPGAAYDVSHGPGSPKERKSVTVTTNQVLRIQTPSGAAAVVQFTRFEPDSGFYRWRYRPSKSQPVTAGIGQVREVYERKPTADGYEVTPKSGHNTTICAGELRIEWSYGSPTNGWIYYYLSRAKVEMLDGVMFEKGLPR